jgi:hypothetical protein
LGRTEKCGLAAAVAKRSPNAVVNKGIALGALERSAGAIAVCDDLIVRFGTATELPLREVVTEAESQKKGFA